MLVGNERKRVMVALRSLFAWAKKNDVVFGNPTSRIRVGRAEDPIWQPLLPEQIARSVAVATTAEARLVVALASVHAALSGAIRRLLVDDVDLANRHLTIAGRTRPLDDLTARLLNEWLDHRRGRWPNTLNRHLLLTRESAVNFGSICYSHIVKILHGLPGTIERLRIDRQLEEALAHSADPLHLAAVFGISESTAIRYANSARQLMECPSESRPVSSSRTQVSTEPDEPPGHFLGQVGQHIGGVELALVLGQRQVPALRQSDRPGRGLQVDGGVVAVDLVNVDPVGAETAQALLDLGDDPPAAVAPAVGFLAHRHVDLSGEHDLVTPPGDGLADDLLGLPGRVHVRGVDEAVESPWVGPFSLSFLCGRVGQGPTRAFKVVRPAIAW